MPQSGGLPAMDEPAAFSYSFVNITIAEAVLSRLSTRYWGYPQALADIWHQEAKTLRHQDRFSPSGGT
jgi:hypothetical protein